MLFGKSNKTPQSDVQTVAQFRATGKRKYAGILFERFGPRVLGVCLKYLRQPADAEDATIDIFEHAFKKLPQTEVIDFGAWIHRIAINHCLMLLRKTKREIPTELLESNNSEETEETDLDAHLERLPALLDALPQGQAQCVRLFYLEEKSYRQITELTGLDIKTVKSHIQNGKRNLAIRLRKDGCGTQPKP